MTRFGKPTFFAMLATSCALLAASAPANAAVFTVRGSPGLSPNGRCSSYDISGSTAVSGSGGCDAGNRAASGKSSADFGQVGAFAIGNANVAPQDSSIIVWSSSASFSDQVIFTSTDPTATHALIAAVFHLDGILDETAALNDRGRQSISISGSVTFNRQFSRFSVSPNGSIPVDLGGLSLVSGRIGPIFGVPTDAILRTQFYRVPLNQLVGYSLGLESRVGLSGTNTFGASLFGNTFEAPVGSDVFLLPSGVTANSGTWLVNNRRVIPGVGGVPEPASWAMMIAGFGLVGGAMRRRAKVRFVTA